MKNAVFVTKRIRWIFLHLIPVSRFLSYISDPGIGCLLANQTQNQDPKRQRR